MSNERTPRTPSFDETGPKLSRAERKIQSLFRRAGWIENEKPAARRQAIRDEFQNLFTHALLDEDSPYTIDHSFSPKDEYSEIFIKKDNKIIATKATYNRPIAGKIETIYNIVRKTPPWRKDLVFQLLEYSPTKNSRIPPIINIGYYIDEGEAQYIITDS